MGDLLYSDAPGALGAFIFFTIILGILGGIATGRAFASTWKSWVTMPLALLALAAAVRFLHFALAGEDLSSLQYYIVSLVFVVLGGLYGYRSKRREQMCRQYPWLFAKSGPLNWSHRA
jgi:hypothetical protein